MSRFRRFPTSLSQRHTLATAAVVLFGLVYGIRLARSNSNRAVPDGRPTPATPAQRTQAAARLPLDLRHPTVEGGRYVVRRPTDLAMLTLEPRIQEAAARVMNTYQVPFGALVALDPHTGRVLAYVSHSSDEPTVQDLALDASPPAASVFKVVTSAALLDAGVTPDTKTCYRGGLHRIDERELVDNPALDTSCVSLATALGGSLNTVFGKLALKHLKPEGLRAAGEMFQFTKTIPFDVDTTASTLDVPSERLEFARTAAGFWHSTMSPLHGAVMAAMVANGGKLVRPYVVQAWVDADGRSTPSPHAQSAGSSAVQVLKPHVAHSLAAMMEKTVTEGTSRSAFYSPKGEPFLRATRVAGKTGSLSTAEPYRAYSWWVGFAPIDRPTIALAALIINGPKWRIKSSYLARVVLQAALSTPKAPPSQPNAAVAPAAN
jgi:peptidoglycan glycosyltransferase